MPNILWEYIMNMLSLIDKRVLTLMMYTTIILKTLTSYICILQVPFVLTIV